MNPIEVIRKILVGRKRYKWDKEYAAGRWDYFHEPHEQERYKALLEFIGRYLGGDKTILEIGCGEGILQERMPQNSYSRFLGIDISKVAIRKAARLKNAITDYWTADMETYTPKDLYDMIIFNEVLYYSDDPIQLMKRYSAFLRPGGYILSSCNETPKSLGIMQDLEKKFTVADQHISKYQKGAWHCKLYSQARPDTPFPNAP